jgi:hypothetical protein
MCMHKSHYMALSSNPFIHLRRFSTVRPILVLSKLSNTLELGNKFVDLLECLIFLHDSRVFLVPANICIAPFLHRIWYVSVSDNVCLCLCFRVSIFILPPEKKYENKYGTTSFHLYPLRFHPYCHGRDLLLQYECCPFRHSHDLRNT